VHTAVVSKPESIQLLKYITSVRVSKVGVN